MWFLSKRRLTKDLGMSRLKSIPRLLSLTEQNRKAISRELLERVETDLDFFQNIATDDETWIYGYDLYEDKAPIVTKEFGKFSKIK